MASAALPGQVSTVVKLSTPLLLFFTTCLPTTLSYSRGHPLFCVPRGNDRICYTLYREQLHTSTAAADLCRMRHTNGRLLTVLDKTTQSMIESSLNGLADQKPESIWLGARLQFLDDWTWVNNEIYNDTELHRFPDRHNEYKRGYVSARLMKDIKVQSFLRMEVVAINDPSQSYHTGALCECLRNNLSECEHTSGKRYYASDWMNRWHEARNRCTNFTQSDLAVLSGDDVGVYERTLKENLTYFIGLRNVRLMWNLSESELEAKYTNWDVNEPTASNNGTDVCAYASNDTWKWRTKGCDESEAFICENASASTASPAPSPDGSTPIPSPRPSGTDRSLLAVLVLVIIAAIITVCVVFFCRRRLPRERPRSATEHTYSSIPERHLTVTEEESAYSIINDTDVTDASYGTKAAATGKAPNGVPVKMMRTDQPSGRSDGKPPTINDTTPPVAAVDHSTVNVTVPDGTGYYTIASVPQSHSQTSSAPESVYETPTPVRKEFVFAQPPVAATDQSTGSQPPTSSAQESDDETPAHVRSGDVFVQPPASEADQLTGNQSPASSAQESDDEAPTPVHNGDVFVQPPASEADQSIGSQPPKTSAQENDVETPTPVRNEFVFAHPPAAVADQSTGNQPQTSSTQESGNDTPVDSAFDRMELV